MKSDFFGLRICNHFWLIVFLSLPFHQLNAQAICDIPAITLLDGSAPFNPSSGAGQDVSDTNGIIRNNDTAVFRVGVTIQQAPATGVRFRATLPAGMAWDVGSSAFCLNTASQAGFGTSSLNCLLKNGVTNNNVHGVGTLVYPFTAKVTNQSDGVVLNLSSVNFILDTGCPSVSGNLAPGNNSLTVSAKRAYDVIKNIFSADPYKDASGTTIGLAYRWRYTIQTYADPTYGIVGLGSLPSSIRINDSVTYETIGGSSTLTGPQQLVTWGALSYCGRGSLGSPAAGSRIGDPGLNATNSVRNSGTMTCTDLGNGNLQFDIAGLDSSLLTTPSVTPAGLSIPAAHKKVGEYYFTTYVNATQIAAAQGINARVIRGIGSLSNILSSTGSSIANTEPTLSSSPAAVANSCEVVTPASENNICRSQAPITFGGPIKALNQTNIATNGVLPGQGNWNDGLAKAVVTQKFYETVLYNNRGVTTLTNAQLCDYWDPSRLTLLHSASSPAHPLGVGDKRIIDLVTNAVLNTSPAVTYEYAAFTYPGDASAGNNQFNCGTITNWTTTPTLPVSFGLPLTISGNPVNAIRVTLNTPLQPGERFGQAFYFQLNPGITVGDYAPNFLSSRPTDSGTWARSAYIPSTHAFGSQGQRVQAISTSARITSCEESPGTANFCTVDGAANDLASTLAAQQMQYRLRPSLTTPNGQGTSLGVKSFTVTTTLPEGMQYVPGSTEIYAEPTVTGTGNSGDPYVLTFSGQGIPDTTIDPLVFKVEVLGDATGLKTNTAVIASEADPTSNLAARTGTSSVNIVSAAGLVISKRISDAVIGPNGSFTYTLEYNNADSVGSLDNIKIIDVLPFVGDGRTPASAFSGTLRLSDPPQASSGSQTVECTTRASNQICTDPRHVSNGGADNSACVALGGGTVSGTTTWFTCAPPYADVTAIRLTDAAGLLPGGKRQVTVPMVTNGNVAGNRYSNNAIGFADGLLGLASSGTVSVRVPSSPVVAKSFSPSAVKVGDTTTLTITITNADNIIGLQQTGTMTDTLPAGLQVNGTTTKSASCGDATQVVSEVGGQTIEITLSRLAPSGTCTITVPVLVVGSAVQFTNVIGACTYNTVNPSLCNANPAEAVLTTTASQNFGVVYDAVTRNPVAGAVVTLEGPVGFNPTIHLLGGTAAVTTSSDGIYRFELVTGAPTGRYNLSVTPPSAYTYQSTLIPPSSTVLTPIDGAPGDLSNEVGVYGVAKNANAPGLAGEDSTLYYLSFNLDVSSATNRSPEINNNHIPLDPAQRPILVTTKVGDRNVVELGDSLKYTVTVRNNGAITAPTASVIVTTDRLPPGFTYIAGTGRFTPPGSTTPIAREPKGGRGPILTFDNLGELLPQEQLTLTYRVRVGVGSQEGDGTNRVKARSGVIESNEARFKVRVDAGVFTREACVIGKVYVDCNNNHMQDAEELGIPGVRLYLNDGTGIVTDVEGKYSLCGMKAQTWVLKADPITLPRKSRLTTTSSRNVGDANSLFLDLKAGELHRADFAEGSCSNTVLEQVKARRAQGEVRSVETETGKPLRFIGKSLNAPQQATDSANQPVVQPRQNP